MLNSNQTPKPAPQQFVTMVDKYKNTVVIPVEQENSISIFKAMGYREVKLNPDTEADGADDQK